MVQAGLLKGLSHARAASEVCRHNLSEAEVIELFKDVHAGMVATALVDRFGLEDASRARMRDLGVTAPWQAFLQVRRASTKRCWPTRRCCPTTGGRKTSHCCRRPGGMAAE